MKDEKEINTSSEKSSEELEATLDKTEDYADEKLNDELEKLAETFRNELNKAKEQGAVKIGEVAVVDENNNVIPEEELCECCGERRKNTEISANYAYCTECRELMKRYPISFASVVIAVVMIVIAVTGVSSFLTDFTGYNSAYLAKKAESENQKKSAVEYYDSAISYFDEKDIVAKKLYKDSAINVFRTLPNGVNSFKAVADKIDTALSDFEAKLPIYSSYKNLRDRALIMYETFNAFYAVLNNSEYGTIKAGDKEKIDTVLKDIGALADKELTIDSLSGGEKEKVTYDTAAVLFTQFMFCYAYEDFDTAYTCLETLWNEYPEFVQMYGYEFATIEVQSGNFKNAVKLADAVKANNAEDSYPYVIYAYSERMKGNFDKALEKVEEGLLIDKENPDLYRKKGIALMLKGETEEAVKALETGLGYSEYGVLYYTYLVALTELEDTEKIEKVNGVLEEAGIEAPERIQKYIDGKLTLKQLFMEGTGDIE